jgi:hypothetical protein
MDSPLGALESRRLLAAGMLDLTFAGDGTADFSGESVALLATTSDHHILAVESTGDTSARLWRLTRKGIVDITFGGGDGNVDLADTIFFDSTALSPWMLPTGGSPLPTPIAFASLQLMDRQGA